MTYTQARTDALSRCWIPRLVKDGLTLDEIRSLLTSTGLDEATVDELVDQAADLTTTATPDTIAPDANAPNTMDAP
jgi:hypothetical protein